MNDNDKPIPSTLLSAFQRFADLSMYWHRRDTPDDLALSELQERIRLSVDIPELIKRLTAFSELGTDAMFAAYAKAKAAPPSEKAGDGWRMLTDGELVEAGDQIQYIGGHWGNAGPSIGTKMGASDTLFRRRLATTAKDAVGDNVEAMGANAPETAISAQEQPSKEAWRMLKTGETINQGDLCGSDLTGWAPTSRWGGTVTEFDEGHYRRRVSPSPEPKLP